MMFFAVEVDAFKPGSSTVTFALGHGTRPHGTRAELADAISSTGTLFASDMGYRTLSTDAPGLVAYPPYVQQAFAIQRALTLDPSGSSIGAAAGQISLANPNSTWDAIAGSWNSDGRAVRVYRGAKTWDATRGYFVDPSYATLTLAFSGMATPWFLTDTELQIPVRDASYWLEQPIQTTLYLGTGTYEGPAALLGTPKPKTRGAATNVTPVLIDPTNLIYQYSDAAGTVTALYEGGKSTYVFSSDTANLYSGSTTAGHYRTDNSRGLFQLGTSPTYAITADVTGQFPSAGAVTVAANIAYYLMTEDAALPAGNLAASSFTAAAAAYAYPAGVHFGPNDNPSGVEAADRVLSAFGAKLIPKRDGTLSVLALRAVPDSTVPVAAWDDTNVVSVVPTALPGGVDPPPYRFRVAYSHNYTQQTSALNPTATATHVAIVAQTDQFAAWSSAANLTAYRRPNDATPFGGALTSSANATTVASDMGALWGVRRRLYNVTVPVSIGIIREIGDVILLTWTMDDLPSGRLAQIVGETFRSQDSTITFAVLV